MDHNQDQESPLFSGSEDVGCCVNNPSEVCEFGLIGGPVLDVDEGTDSTRLVDEGPGARTTDGTDLADAVLGGATPTAGPRLDLGVYAVFTDDEEGFGCPDAVISSKKLRISSEDLAPFATEAMLDFCTVEDSPGT